LDICAQSAGADCCWPRSSIFAGAFWYIRLVYLLAHLFSAPHPQLSIILTGNYNFFNWLTIVLCFPLFDDRFLSTLLILPASAKRELGCGPGRRRRREWLSWGLLVLVIAATGFVCWHAFEVDWARMFDGSAPNLTNPHPAVKLSFTPGQWAEFLHLATPLSITAGALFLVAHALRSLWQATAFLRGSEADPSLKVARANALEKKKPQQGSVRAGGGVRCLSHAVMLTAVLSCLFLASTVPFSKSADNATSAQLPAFARTCYAFTQPWLATHPYGLFARYTCISLTTG
jgi:hypothetical protein